MRLPTQPHHWADDIPSWVLSKAYDRMTGKSSHFWHWYPYQKPLKWTVSVPTDISAGDRTKGWMHNLLFTDFLWKRVAILVPLTHSGPYHLGYTALEGSQQKTELCSLILKGATAVQLGPYQTKFFAVDLNGEPVELMVIALMSKKALRKRFGLKIIMI